MDSDLKAFLKEQFSDFEQRIDQRFEEMTQQIGGLRGEFQAFREETSTRFDRVEDEIRHAHVSIEGLRGEVRLVAEGVANTNERLDRRMEEVTRKIDEVDSRHRSAYQSLDSRVRKLDGAV